MIVVNDWGFPHRPRVRRVEGVDIENEVGIV